jgi:hypothetical protein
LGIDTNHSYKSVREDNGTAMAIGTKQAAAAILVEGVSEAAHPHLHASGGYSLFPDEAVWQGGHSQHPFGGLL